MRNIHVKRALISVSDKSGLADFAKVLTRHSVEIVSTGGTADFLRSISVPVRDVSEITGIDELLGGRVKTLHPKIHAPILADVDNMAHLTSLEQLGVGAIDLVVVNLYPFAETVKNSEAGAADIIEQIDIGGCALIRAAAKNHARVVVVVDPCDYSSVIESVLSVSPHLRRRLATKAYAHTSLYDSHISQWLSMQYANEQHRNICDYDTNHQCGSVANHQLANNIGHSESIRDSASSQCPTTVSESPQNATTLPANRPPPSNIIPGNPALHQGVNSSIEASISISSPAAPQTVFLAGRKLSYLRYGENSHQSAALYATNDGGLANASILAGKSMSYNNYLDADVALKIVSSFDLPTVSFVKHNNPCGIASHTDIAKACRNAYESDPTSAFGGVIALNREVTCEIATQIAPIFIEVIVAPSYNPRAFEILSAKKNLRIIEISDKSTSCSSTPPASTATQIRQISGGFLLQDTDSFDSRDTFSSWIQVAGPRIPTPFESPDSSITTPMRGSGTLATDETTNSKPHNPVINYAPTTSLQGVDTAHSTFCQLDHNILQDLQFAWKACAFAKSNAILLAKNLTSIGIGMGQVNRLDACNLAVSRAGARALGASAASDAFFPFADGLNVLINAGVKAIVQPGGSIRDNEVIAAAEKAGVIMFFTGKRHFVH